MQVPELVQHEEELPEEEEPGLHVSHAEQVEHVQSQLLHLWSVVRELGTFRYDALSLFRRFIPHLDSIDEPGGLEGIDVVVFEVHQVQHLPSRDEALSHLSPSHTFVDALSPSTWTPSIRVEPYRARGESQEDSDGRESQQRRHHRRQREHDGFFWGKVGRAEVGGWRVPLGHDEERRASWERSVAMEGKEARELWPLHRMAQVKRAEKRKGRTLPKDGWKTHEEAHGCATGRSKGKVQGTSVLHVGTKEDPHDEGGRVGKGRRTTREADGCAHACEDAPMRSRREKKNPSSPRCRV